MNYNCTYRTNYFSVKDKDYFERMIECAKRFSEDVNILTDESGKVALAGYGSIAIYYDPDDDFAKNLDSEDNCIYEELQKCVADDDAILFKEAGHEGLRYIVLEAVVITSKCMEFITVDEQMQRAAMQLLENESWTTKLEY